MDPAYDRIGVGYAGVRRTDPRIAAQINDALGAARTVVNIGAGTGSYEPPDQFVVGVEPSTTMIDQRRERAAVVRGVAESLPFGDSTFDAALATLTVHHWKDKQIGLAEMCRVAPRRVLLTFDWDYGDVFWLFRDYLAEVRDIEHDNDMSCFANVVELLDEVRVEPVPVPHDCRDGFASAYWRRPERYLDPAVRAGISFFNILDHEIVDRAVARLEADLTSGRWYERNADLLDEDEVDLGYRLIVSG